MRFPSCHRWTMCVTPKSPKGWLDTRIFTFGVDFHFFIAGNRRHFTFCMWVEHCKSRPTDDKPSLKMGVVTSGDPFLIFSFPKISLERLKLETLYLVCMLIIASSSLRTTNCLWKGRDSCYMTFFNFRKMSDNISKTVQDSLIVFIKCEYEFVCALSNLYVADDLWWPLSTSNHLNFYILHCLMHLRNW